VSPIHPFTKNTTLASQSTPPQTEPPVVWSWLPFLGSAVAFGQAPLDFIRESSARMQAPCFVLVLAGERTCFVADPALWAQVFRERRRLR
jgi:hypothetical protein